VDKANAQQQQEAASGHWSRPPRSLAFFAFFYLYFAFGIDLRLLYHGGGLVDGFPCFYSGWGFFRSFLAYPGGMIEYLSALLAQSFFHSWLGAAVMTGQAWGSWVCAGCILRAFGTVRLRGLRYLAPLVLVGVYCRYGFPFVTTMGLLAALAAACLYGKLDRRSEGGTVAVFLVGCLFLYVTTAGSVLVFIALCGLHELLLGRRWRLALAQLTLGAITPYMLGVLVYGDRISDAYCRVSPLSWELLGHSSFRDSVGAVWVLALFVPLTAAALGIRQVVRPSKRPPSAGQADRGWGVGLNLPTLALACVTAAVVLLCRSPARKVLLQADYFSRQRMWAQVLDLGRRNPYQYLLCHMVDRALCQSDRLGDEMFLFPQHPTALLLTDPAVEPFWQRFDTCLDLGLINHAENSLLLCMQVYGERPLLLHRLATVHLIKGNIETAGVYLRSLAKVPFWKSMARRDLARIEIDPDLSEDAGIQGWRSLMLKGDSVRAIDTLTVLLAENRANRAAYQYGLAFKLLSKDLDGFARMFDRYHPQSPSRIPRHWEEAIALAQTLGRWPKDVPGQTVSPEMTARLQEFLHMLRQTGTDEAAVRLSLKKEFGDTYFHYYFMGR